MSVRQAWYVWHSGMGSEFTPVEVLSIGSKGQFATCRSEDRTRRLRLGDLILIESDDEIAAWAESYR